MKKLPPFTLISLITCLVLVAVCFIPWVHFNRINLTFSGFNVTRFPSGSYYGKPWKAICIFCTVIFCLDLVNNGVAQKANLFLAALLLAYCIRTYILFTGSLFAGEVSSLPGIYLIVFLSLLLLVCAAFPDRLRGSKTRAKQSS